jgi:valyl-tRNA synthetase
VYFTGMVRDNQGRKMSKQLGNSPDVLGLIEQYGADAVRFGIMIASPAGNDILFDESALEQGRNFNNKMWNALKLIQLWKSRGIQDLSSPEFISSDLANPALEIMMAAVASEDDVHTAGASFAISWFENRLRQVRSEVNEMLDQFRLSEALKVIYSLIWDDFCSWYLEWVKPGFEQPIEGAVYNKTIEFFTALMELLHPFMPFVTEEIYHLLEERTGDLMVKEFGHEEKADAEILNNGVLLKNIITGLRDVRNKNQIKPKEPIRLHVQSANADQIKAIESILAKQINSSAVSFVDDAVPGTITSVIGKDKFYIETEQPLNTAGQKEGLEKELAYFQGFLATIEKKLGNEKFVANAKPEVIALEQKKKADALDKIKVIEESLASL